MGISAKSCLGRDHLIYAAQINEIVSLEEYGSDARFAIKRPETKSISAHGDNIYFKDPHGVWQQRPNDYHGENEKDHDLNGKNVLIAKDFWYFGGKAPKIPTHLNLIGNARIKYLRDEKIVKDFIVWINSFPKGIIGDPSGTGATCKTTCAQIVTGGCASK